MVFGCDRALDAAAFSSTVSTHTAPNSAPLALIAIAIRSDGLPGCPTCARYGLLLWRGRADSRRRHRAAPRVQARERWSQ